MNTEYHTELVIMLILLTRYTREGFFGGTPMLARMLVTKNHLVTTKPLGEKKVQLVRTKFSWREKSAVGETKNQLARKKFSW